MHRTIEEMIANGFGTLPEFIRVHAQMRPEHIAVRHQDASLTYQELDHLMDRFAAGLQKENIAQGAHISVCGLSSIHYVIVFLGTLRAGMTIAPLAPSSTPNQLASMLEDCAAPLFFIDAGIEEHMRETPLSTRVIRFDEDSFEAFLGDAEQFKPVTIAPADAFNVIYSSGTTGTPKGIVQAHKMRWAMMIPNDPPGFGPDAVTLLSTPLYSNTTMTCFIPTLSGGGTVILMEKFNVQGYLELAQKWCVTHTMLVPVQYRRIMSDPEFASYDLSHFEMKFCTSAPFAAALKADVLARWPGGLIEYYGMTEGGGSCALVAHNHPDKLDTVGQPLPGHTMFAIREDGTRCDVDEVGEIVGTSAFIMRGYHNQPEKTRETEWYDEEGVRHIRTGDIGRFDADGFLTLMDRKKDMIISGGFNIYPSDIEAILATHPDIVESAVVGVPSDEWGETPVGFFVLRDGASVSGEDVRLWLNERVGKTQRLNAAVVLPQLPRSAIGKILKRELRDEFKA